MHYFSFHVWLILLNMRSSTFAVNDRILFSFFMAEKYSTVFVYHIFFVHLYNGHLGRFHILMIMNSPAISTVEQISLLYSELMSLGCIPNGELARPYGRSIYFSLFLFSLPLLKNSPCRIPLWLR